MIIWTFSPVREQQWSVEPYRDTAHISSKSLVLPAPGRTLGARSAPGGQAAEMTPNRRSECASGRAPHASHPETQAHIICRVSRHEIFFVSRNTVQRRHGNSHARHGTHTACTRPEHRAPSRPAQVPVGRAAANGTQPVGAADQHYALPQLQETSPRGRFLQLRRPLDCRAMQNGRFRRSVETPRRERANCK
jgi:hypothetical protein